MKRGWWILKFMVMGVVMIALVGVVTQQLWNWLVPALFNGPAVTFGQALGLLVLSKIFFWSFGKHYGGGHWQGGPWRRHYWKEKWGGMTPEEREVFKRKMKDRWCVREPDASTRESGASNE